MFGKLKTRLLRTHTAIMGGLESVLGSESRLASLDALEEALVSSDVGVKVASELVDGIKDSLHLGRDAAASRMRDMIYLMIKGVEAPLAVSVGGPPFVVMVLGVNGVGA